MPIKKQIMVLSIIMGFIFLIKVILVLEIRNANQELDRKSLQITSLLKDVFDLTVASGDYSRSHNQRPLEQMARRIKSIGKSVETMDFTDPENQIFISGVRTELVSAERKFEALKLLHNKFHEKYNREVSEDVDIYIHQEIEDLSRSLSVSSMALVNLGQFLLSSYSKVSADEMRLYNNILLSGILASFIILLTVVMFFSRRFVVSLNNLKSGAAQIASGDLSLRIKETGNDELTELTRSFNSMTQKLEESYNSIRQEIEERKKTEVSLLKSEQMLLEREESVSRLNLSLEKQLAKLVEANREMESFTYSVSHDLRAPLRHITGFVEMLNKRDTSGLDEKSRHYLKVISDSAKKMGCLIDDLLSFSRMGRGEMARGKVDLKDLAMEVVDEISKDLPAGKKIQWVINDLPIVTGDRAMLRLVLVNLLSNSVKYSAAIEVPVVEIGLIPSDDENHVFFVKDNGIGFDMKYVDKLFGLFQRLHSSEEYEGTGVGLANVRRIILRHGGKTWAEGEPNNGASFYFTLPKKEKDQNG